jgi:tripartite-type tricarboxylate transporter receptor subunit TctC
MIGKRALLVSLAASTLSLALAGAASPQTYPDKPIKIIVAVAAGGPMDTMARAVALQMQAKLGQPVVVENRPGAGTTIGAKAVFTAEPDGLTLLWGTLSMVAIAPVIYKDLDFDPRQLLPVALVAEFPSVLVIPPSLPVNTMAEFVTYAKTNRGKLNYGGSLGTPPMLQGMIFNKLADLGMTYVPYRGGAPSIPDLIAGRLHMQWDALTLLVPLIREGKLKGLAVQTPQPIVARINATINDILQSPETKTALVSLNVLLRPGSPQEFAEFVAKETPAWAAMVRESGATAQ